MSNIDDYQTRLDDLLADASGDEIDPVDLLINALADFIEGELEGEDDKTLCIDFGDKSLIISMASNDETETARLH